MLTLYYSFVAKIWLQSAEIGKIALVIIFIRLADDLSLSFFIISSSIHSTMTTNSPLWSDLLVDQQPGGIHGPNSKKVKDHFNTYYSFNTGRSLGRIFVLCESLTGKN